MIVATACSPVTGGTGTGNAGPAKPTQTAERASASPSPWRSPEAAPPKATPPSAGAVASFASLFKNVASGVERIDTSDCTGAYAASGFLLRPDLVATAAHVVEGQGVIRVTSPTSHVVTTATVIGISHEHDLALLRTSVPLAGHLFTLAIGYPEPASELMAVGFPLGGRMQQTRGSVNTIHDHLVVAGPDTEYHISDAVITDAALNPGNSGGPWLNLSGQVIAIDESGPADAHGATPTQGNNAGVSSVVAAGDFEEWAMSPQPTEFVQGCPVAPNSEEAALDSLEHYFYDIDNSDYDSAYAQLSPVGRGSYQGFLRGVLTSEDAAPIESAGLFREDGSGITADGQRYIDATFVSHQDADHAPAGTRDTCDVWSLRYTFSVVNNVPLIVGTRAQPGRPAHEAC